MNYTVVSGDTISKIANKFHVSTDAIIGASKARYPSLEDEPDAIEIGWVLTVPDALTPSPKTAGVGIPQVAPAQLPSSYDLPAVFKDPKIWIAFGLALAATLIGVEHRKKLLTRIQAKARS